MVKWVTLWKLLPIVILFGHTNTRSAPTFRVVAPQTICEKSKNQSTLGDSQMLIISFYPTNGEKLSYKFQIFFKHLGNYRSQRRTLELWKSVRSLEERINVRDRLQISDRNLLIINNTELMSGIAYIFHVIGTTLKGVTTKSQNFTIKYLGGNVKSNDNNAPSNVNLLLFGPEYTLVKIPFILVAKVINCKPRFDYYFQWNISGLGEKVQKYLETPRSDLTIPENTLKAGEEYHVNVSLLQANTSRKLAQNTFRVRVQHRQIELLIFPTKITIGLNQTTHIEVVINHFDEDNIPFQIQWLKTSPSGKQHLCEHCKGINSTKLNISFHNPGMYIVIAKVIRESLRKTVSCEVSVETDLLVNYVFESVPSLVVMKGQRFYYTLLVKDLLPNCHGNWSTISEKGFEVFPQSAIDLGSFKVNDMERNYLLELSDFGNSTVSREVSLFIPETSTNFEGLKGDCKYKFRLTITCPTAFLNKSNKEQGYVKSFFEFIVSTNSPPRGLPLKVQPVTGYALQTVFQYVTGEAKDLEIDGPLCYEFLYIINNLTVSIGVYYDYGTTDTILPYSDSPIQTMYRVCDVRSACSLIKGPNVKVTLGDITLEEIQQKKQEITSAFQRMDFYIGQRLIHSCATTFQKLKDQSNYDNFRAFSIELLSKEIDKQYEQSADKVYFSQDDIYKFVKLSKQNFELLDISEVDMIRKLLELLESAAEEVEIAENIEFRRKRQVQYLGSSIRKSIVNSDFALLSLELMERLLKSLDNEKRHAEKINILEKVNQLSVKMCRSNNTSAENIGTDMVTLKIWKLLGKQILAKKFSIEIYKIQKSGYFMIKSTQLKDDKMFCMTLIQYSQDHLSNDPNDPIYSIELYDNDSVALNKDVASNIENNSQIELLIPTARQAEKCVMWSEGNWLEEDCESKMEDGQALCKCRRLGYIKLSVDDSATLFSTTGGSYQSSFNSPSVTTQVEYSSQTFYVKANQLGDVTSSVSAFYTMLPTVDISNKTRSNITAASLMDYMLPFICILFVLVIIGGLVLYQRRRRQVKNLMEEIESVEPRELAPGIKYGKFFDEHLLNGNM